MIDFYLKKGDLLPVLRVQLTDLNDDIINISGSSVDFNYKIRSTGSSTVYRSATIENATSGIVQYAWVSGDVTNVGIYNAEFVVTFPDGKQSSFPQSGPMVFSILEDI